MPSHNAKARKCLDDLPDELILEAIEWLRPTPCDDHEDTDSGSLMRSGLRFLDNEKRLEDLLALSLTSRRISRITEVVLYSTILVDSPGRSGHLRLTSLLSTLLQKPCLANHVTYIENIYRRYNESGRGPRQLGFLDEKKWYGGNRWDHHVHIITQAAKQFWNDSSLQAWTTGLAVLPEYSQLTLLIALSPNVKQLVLQVHEESTPSFWDCLGIQTTDGLSLPLPGFHSLSKLHKLYISTLQIPDNPKGRYPRFVSALRKIPSLQHYRHTGPCGDPSSLPVDVQLHSLQTIHLMECEITIDHIAKTLEGCTSLKSFKCSWVPMMYTDLSQCHFVDLINGLLVSKDTLEHVDIALGEIGWDFKQFPQIGSFAGFPRLKSMSLDEILLLGILEGEELLQPRITARPAVPISQCLPLSLQSLTMTCYHTDLTDESLVLWDFAKGISQFARLEKVRLVAGSGNRGRDALKAHFAEHGVTLETEM
ncbi:hypothetical protein BDV95DRAFT_610623 [Massariosphaeria phaeospora]|uniref:F-box domain-containing protein n=1 Tax=Massariosphaeria phaeospora TaxID=100035 RepID=A0A7C8M242_9PLEO|nr:hypothetical protein BDV95DRAFT_610623 [Massariosphaeria phaeospora]